MQSSDIANEWYETLYILTSISTDSAAAKEEEDTINSTENRYVPSSKSYGT